MRGRCGESGSIERHSIACNESFLHRPFERGELGDVRIVAKQFGACGGKTCTDLIERPARRVVRNAVVSGGARKGRLARQNLGPRVCIAQRVDQPAAVVVAIDSQPARMPHLPAGGQRGFLVEESGKEFLLAPRETAHAAFA